VTQLLLYEPCPRCRRGYTKRDSNHAKGCRRRALTFGESLDEMSPEKQLVLYQLMREPGVSFEEWLAGLYRGRKRRAA